MHSIKKTVKIKLYKTKKGYTLKNTKTQEGILEKKG